MADELIKLDANSRQTLAGLDKDTGEIRNIGMDEDSEGLHVNQWVWDTATAAWIRMTQPVIELTTSNLYLALDGVEGSLTAIEGYIDGVEGSLTTIEGYLDGVEASLTLMTDTLGHYFASDIDESGDPAYYGFLDKAGNWYILEVNTASGTYRYEVGASAYSTAWTNRATQSYGYFDAKF